MRILVTGASGQLGTDAVAELRRHGHDIIGTDLRADANGRQPNLLLDITERDAVLEAVSETCPDAILHCAAWTQVDLAEEPEHQRLVHAINAEGTAFLAEAASNVDAKFLYISTDYVFDGTGNQPWKPDDPHFGPLNYYGLSKLEGEEAVRRSLTKYFIVRISGVFGHHGSNFVRTILKVGSSRPSVRVVADQIGTPTYTPDLACLLADMIETDRYGCYHATNEGGYISWYDFCCEIYRQAGMKTEVIPVTTEEYGLSKAVRPLNSRLDKSKLVEAGFTLLPTWQDALARFLGEEPF